MWVLSAKTDEALRAQAARLTDVLDRDALDTGAPPDPADLAYSLATTRSGFTHRAAVTGETLADLRDGLARLAEDAQAATPSPGRAPAGGRHSCSPARARSGSEWAAASTTPTRCSPGPWTRPAPPSTSTSTPRYGR
ncbi:CurL C-terminal domain-containing protein [Rhodococcus aetherivorans]